MKKGGEKYDVVSSFCHQGRMLNVEGGADEAVTARGWCAWTKLGAVTSIPGIQGHEDERPDLHGTYYEELCLYGCFRYMIHQH